MIGRNELVKYLDDLLEIGSWRAIDSSLNGLQIEGGREKIGRIAFSVDSGVETFSRAAALDADMLIVHHGLFWGEPLAIVGSHRRRVATLLESGTSLYAAHLPLDFHPQLGHNVVLSRWLGLEEVSALTKEGGLDVGVIAKYETPLPLDSFVSKVEGLLDCKCRVLAFGSDKIEKVGMVVGHGSKLLTEDLSAELDLFLTGEHNHTVYHFAQEWGVNVVFAGHYASEVPGLKALATHIEERFGSETVFIDCPTGM